MAKPEPPPVPRLLLSAREAAEACGVRERLWGDLNRTGLVPSPIKLGRRRLWSLAVLRQWVDQSCPRRHKFKPMEYTQRGKA